MTDVEIVAVESPQVDAETRLALRALWRRAYGDRFTDDDADHAYGGVHVLSRDGGRLVGHASVVPRRIRFGDGPWRSVGYVEAVATDPDRQREGVGRRTMERLHDEIGARWSAAMLSTGRATGFYELLGWERWLGPTYVQTAAGVVSSDDDHGGLMVLRLDSTVGPDVRTSVTCEDRVGDAW